MVSVIELETNKLIYNHKFIKKGEIGSFDWLNDERLLFTRLTKSLQEKTDCYKLEICTLLTLMVLKPLC